ncbi:MAG: hypothetical protein M0Q43_08970 [Methanothrix sp.]|nr:hypothetical protein [Methanothrix sp.]
MRKQKFVGGGAISGIRSQRMPRSQGSWLSTVPWAVGGYEATLGLWWEALSVAHLC